MDIRQSSNTRRWLTLEDGDEGDLHIEVWIDDPTIVIQRGDYATFRGSPDVFANPQRSELRVVFRAEELVGIDLDASRQKFGIVAKLRKDRRPLAPLPTSIARLAVVTGSTSNAPSDIEEALARQDPKPTVTYFECQLHNRKSIADAIATARASNPDALVIARGGDERHNLAPFDSILVIEAIVDARVAVPVVTGIGHADDKVLADEFATISSSTPTQAIHDLYYAIARLSDAARAEKAREQEAQQARAAAAEQQQRRRNLVVAAAVLVALILLTIALTVAFVGHRR